MKKKYFYIIFIITTFFSLRLQAQENKSIVSARNQEPTIEGLTIYPNPVNSEKFILLPNHH